MTRETKVGIVVSCSFLGLLGVVVTSKLRGELPPEKAEAAAVPDKAKKAPKREPLKSAPTRKETGTVLVKADTPKAAPVGSTDRHDATPPPAAPAPPGSPTPAAGGEPMVEVPPAPEGTLPPTPGSPAPAPDTPPVKEGVEAAPPASIPPPEVTPAAEGVAALPENPAAASVEDLGPPLGIAFALGLQATLEKQKGIAGGDPAAALSPPPAPPAAEKVDESKPGNGDAATAAGKPGEGTTPVVPSPGPPGDPAPTPPPAPAAEVGAAPAVIAAPAPVGEDKDKPKPQGTDPAIPAIRPVKATTGGGELEESPLSPPPEKRPAAVPVAVSRTTPSNKPKVDVFSVEEYAVQPGDTFATISKAKYQSDKYAEALRLFNANDALLSDAGRDAAVKLQPGQSITIPDLTILEKRYNHVIKGLPPGGALAPATGTSRKTEFDVRPVVNLRLAPGAAPTYEVRQEGVTMREVAARTLSNGDRWNEILRLNREYNPERALPVGVVLKLPADARGPKPVPTVP